MIDAVRPYVPPGSAIVTDWLDATSLAYGAYVDGSLPGRIIVSDDKLRVPLYQRWAKTRRVFVLVEPPRRHRAAGRTRLRDARPVPRTLSRRAVMNVAPAGFAIERDLPAGFADFYLRLHRRFTPAATGTRAGAQGSARAGAGRRPADRICRHQRRRFRRGASSCRRGARTSAIR